MIYIDPPYNTGNDFVYNDTIKTDKNTFNTQTGIGKYEGEILKQFVMNFERNLESNGRFHSDWLSMMYSRLKLARNLLSDDGVIFISIDDNEQDNLKKICDEVFGEENFIAQICWRRTDNQPNIGNIARVKEYLITFAKLKEKLVLGKLPLSEKAKKEYRYTDSIGFFRRGILLDKTRGRHHYEIITKTGKVLTGPWMIRKEELMALDEQNLIYWTVSGDEQPYKKIYLNDSKGQIANDFWGIEVGTNQRASLEVENLFDKRIFSFPKPISFVHQLLHLSTNKDSLVLDFFAGSGTTAHAVMQLNAEDGGNRKFIMVQLPELTDEKSEAYKAGYKTIAEISKERIRRAGAQIAAQHSTAQHSTAQHSTIIPLILH
ncbi:site-specific DNA-methyltransferase [Pelistega indica]|uniref:site-specific DNA-methyltransferase n=1 Tax=Pelistega indica TaxID=1414851 RepID=UPI00068D1F7E|nr:site-specific DNA-methyltransferase [Pelistega indica]